jgi:hypothetical protein
VVYEPNEAGAAADRETEEAENEPVDGVEVGGEVTDEPQDDGGEVADELNATGAAADRGTEEGGDEQVDGAEAGVEAEGGVAEEGLEAGDKGRAEDESNE